jgi:uncharacterized protein with HEPN domain
MPPEDRDAAYLLDMLRAAKTAMEMVGGASFESYLSNRMMQLAVERTVEIVGEAAQKVSTAFRDAHPEIPWRGIIAQRHVLAHEYGAIQHERIWRLTLTHIPELIQLLEALVPPPPRDT